MSQRTLQIFTTTIISLTVGILLAALVAHLPPQFLTDAFALLLQPAGLQYATLAAIGLFAVVEIIALLPRSVATIDPTWHLALFPGMPTAIGSLPSAEDL